MGDSWRLRPRCQGEIDTLNKIYVQVAADGGTGTAFRVLQLDQCAGAPPLHSPIRGSFQR